MDSISKQVISVDDKKVVGYVLKPWIDFSTLKKVGYIIVEDESEQEYFLKNDNILSENDVILIQNLTFLEISHFQNEFRKKVYSLSGGDYGVVRDYLFYRNTLRKLITDKAEIGARFISSVGDEVVFVSFKKKKRIFPRFKNEDIKVEAMDKKVELPMVINLSPSYYLGKVATRTLLGINNELIVKEGVTINKQIFDRAKRHNKINELFFICK